MNGFYIKIVTSLRSLKFYCTFHAQIIIQKYLHNALVALVQTLLTSKRVSKISMMVRDSYARIITLLTPLITLLIITTVISPYTSA